MAVKHWILASRPKTLLAAVGPVVVGTAMAMGAEKHHALSASLALLSAVAIQIGTNLFNDYADFKKGADTHARKGPTRVTQAGLIKPQAVLTGAIAAFAFAVVAGAYLMWRGGLPIVVIGIFSILFGFTYTAGRYSLSYLGIADLFVLIFFGPVAVAGTYFVQTLEVSREVILAGIAPGCLAVAILLVNNIRDVNEDSQAGKKTLVVRLGRSAGVKLYAAMLAMAATIPVLLAVMGRRFVVLGAALVPVAGIFLLMRLARARTGDEHNKLLAQTGQLLFAYCLVFSLVWVYSMWYR